MENKKNKSLLQNTLLVIISLIIAMIMVETILRYDFEPRFPWPEQSCFRLNKQDLTKGYVVDSEFGFRPILGNNYFNEFGTRCNQYEIHKKPGITRLLFLGDSITARGKIINALKELYGEEKFEYWNAGVESFNTVQEVKFYEQYNKRIKPDKVILFFHINDLGTTPVAFLNNENKIVVYSPYQPTIIASRWLFKHSALYRIALASYLKLVSKTNGKITKEVKDEVRRSIKRLKNILDQEHIKFTAVVVPIIDSYDKWSNEEKGSRSEILNILHDFGIRYIDLTEVIFQLTSESIHIVRLSTDRDRCHPEDRLASFFANFLYKRKILE